MADVTIKISGATDKQRALRIAQSVLDELLDDSGPHAAGYYFDFESFSAKRYEAQVTMDFSDNKI